MSIRWPEVLAHGRKVVAEYDTAVTLRQLFYRLVAAGLIPNQQTAYKSLSDRTAKARRAGEFPDLVDNNRRIHQPITFDGRTEALGWLSSIYRRDRTEFMDLSVFLGVEKATMIAQLESWFEDRGLPIIALGGYASQSYVDEIREDVLRRNVERVVAGLSGDAVLLYAGDFDPSGEDIARDFIARTGLFRKVERVALDWSQVQHFNLPAAPGKTTDSRAAAFQARHGQLVQVELEALDPADLRRLYEHALAPFWDDTAYQRSLDQENRDLSALRKEAG